MDLTQNKALGAAHGLIPLSARLGGSILKTVATATVDNVVLDEGVWEISILSGSTADQVSVKPLPSATAAPAFATIQPVPTTLTDGLLCYRADRVVRIFVEADAPKIHLAHSNGGTLTFLLCRAAK
jgi:hypothetical protein